MKRVTWFLVLGLMLIFAVSSMAFDMKAYQTAKQKEMSGQQLTTQEKALIEEAERLKAERRQNDELDELGGPDDYGYSFIDSQEEGGPVYSWIDITETGTEIDNMGDDSFQGPFDLPFIFNYYGTDYDEIYICSNGYLMFGGGSSDLSNDPIPSTFTPNNIICFFWDDLNPNDATSGNIFYGEDEDGNWICTFDDVEEYGGNDGHITCQTILYPNGEILMQYMALDDDIDINGESIGIENDDGTIGLQVANNVAPADYPFNELAILFYLPAAGASVTGTVTDVDTGDPIAGALVSVGGGNDTTDDMGVYLIEEALVGDFILTATADLYYPYTEDVTLVEGENTIDFAMAPAPNWDEVTWSDYMYDWVDIAEPVNDLLSGDDQGFELIFDDYDLGTFDWYGEVYNSVYAVSNGFLSFTSSVTFIYGDEVPDPADPNATLAGLFSDHNPSAGGAIYAASDDNRLVVSWEETPYYGTENLNTFQIILDFDDNSVIYNYSSVSDDAGFNIISIGYEDQDGVNGEQIHLDEVPPDETSYRIFIPAGGGTLTGTVTDADGGAAIENAFVYVMDADDEVVLWTQTGADGTYEFGFVEPGTYNISFMAISYQGHYVADFEVVDGENILDASLTMTGEYSIEQIQTELELDTWVTTTGIVTQPTNSTTTGWTSFYIQDDTGYGVQVYSPEATDEEDNIDRGMQVLVTGIIDEYNGVTEIVDFVYEIIDEGNDLPAPYVLPTGDMAAANDMEGTWVRVSGELMTEPGEGSYNIEIDDGSGPVTARIWEATGIDLTGLTAGDIINVRGIIGLFQDNVQIIPALQNDIYVVEPYAPTGLMADLDAETGQVTLSWMHEPPMGELEEIIYDDGTAENGLYYNANGTPGSVMGVRFTAPGPCTIYDVSVYAYSDGGAVTMNDYELMIWDGNDENSPGDLLFEGDPFTPEDDDWTLVDVSAEGIMVEEDFWAMMAFTVCANPPAGGPFIGMDESGPQDHRSFIASAPNYTDWTGLSGIFPSSEFMVRATVELEGGVMMTLSYSDGDVQVEQADVTTNPELVNMVSLAGVPANHSVENELDEFVEFAVYRDDVEVGRTSEMTYVDQLPQESGTYTYTVQAVFDEGTSDLSDPVDVVYDYDYVSEEMTGVPSVWSIARTYPNPFNPTVNIVLAVPRTAQVEATIVNVLGQQVATLHNDQLKAGYHTLNWSAHNHPSGLYFVQVNSADGFTGVKKLMFIK